MGLERKSTERWVNTCVLFVCLISFITACVKAELRVQGGGFEVHEIELTDGKIREFKVWFRTKQPSGMVMMSREKDGEVTLAGMYEGKMRCLYITNCASPATWKAVTISEKSFNDGKWHRLIVRTQIEDFKARCEVDGISKKTNVRGLNRNFKGIVFLGGLPDMSQNQEVNSNGTCFTDVANFSGCITNFKVAVIYSHGFEELSKTQAKRFGTVFSRCGETKHFVISITDKKTKASLSIENTNWDKRNTSFEFHVLTRSTRGSVAKITNHKLTALFFLEEGKLKITLRLKTENTRESGSLHVAANENFLADGQWHSVILSVAMENEVTLVVDDRLRAKHAITPNTKVKDSKVLQNMVLRIGRSSRKTDPSFVGCLRDVFVNNWAVNFSEHSAVKNANGISVGRCPDLIFMDPDTWEDGNRANKTLVQLTKGTLTTEGGSSTAEQSSAIATSQFLPKNAPISTSVHPEIQAESTQKSVLERAFPIVVALSVCVIFVVLVYMFGTWLRSRVQNWQKRNDNARGENAPAGTNTSRALLREDKENPCLNVSKRLRVDDQSDDKQHMNNAFPFGKQDVISKSSETTAFPKQRNPIFSSVWEERYGVLGNVSEPHPSVPTGGNNSSRSSIVRHSSEKLAGDRAGTSCDVYMAIPSIGSCRAVANRDGCKANIGYGTSVTVGSPQSSTRLTRVYADYGSLPRAKKPSSLSWAYGTRLVRNESSDTDCSDAERVSGPRQRYQAQWQKAKFIMVRPRHLIMVSESSDNEEMSHDILASRNRLIDRNHKFRTFSEKKYTLHSLKEDRENESENRGGFSINAPKVSRRQKNVNCGSGNRCTSLAEASILYEEAVSISTQVRTLDGYTSSCPESIHCLSEKEDGKELYIKQMQRPQ